VLFVQVAVVFDPPAAHSLAEQQLVEVEGMQVSVFAQYFWPLRHLPAHGAVSAIHVPLQFCGALAGQAGTQAVPLQVTEPPTGFLQAVVHSEIPQVSSALLLTHAPLQLCQPELQRMAQVPF
jgi:hypothetical protein